MGIETAYLSIKQTLYQLPRNDRKTLSTTSRPNPDLGSLLLPEWNASIAAAAQHPLL